MTLEDKLQEIYELTYNHCGCENDPSRPFRCCSVVYCEMAFYYAAGAYGIHLQPTSHAIPFMGKSGCVVPPYLRPVCTLHACCVAYADKSGWKDEPERTRRYFRLRHEILAELHSRSILLELTA